MLPLHVAAAVLNQTPMDWDENQSNIVSALDDARARGADVVCLPELAICGYGCEDAFYAGWLRRTSLRRLGAILPATRGLVVTLGLPVMHRNALFNSCCLAVDGRIAGFVAKRHLAGDGLHYEPRWFKPWPEGERAEFEGGADLPGGPWPIGDLHFDIGGVRFGFEICEDAWVASRPGAALAARGVDVILNPSASHFSFGKQEVRRRLVLEGSRAFGATYVYTNVLGNEAGRIVYDGGALIATRGEMVAAGRRFSYRRFELINAVVDIDATRSSQARSASFQPSVGRDPLAVLVNHQFRGAATAAATPPQEAWEGSAARKEEEFLRATALGLFDYARKSRTSGFVVSLSGGADSAATACLVGLMVRLACADIGVAAFRETFRHAGLAGADARDLVGELLTTVYQATANSGAVTRDAARQVAEAINARHVEWNVESIVREYVALAERAEGRTLDWSRDDLSLQNIQARVRSPGAWLLANLHNALLLTTSNRSEAAVGYNTMDGDTSGGLAPVAGIDKDFLRAWLRWLETDGPVGLEPITALSAINSQAPTAELRPRADAQTDEADLMPYAVLELIEDAAIGRGMSPAECLSLLEQLHQGAGDSTRRRWITRFFSLWSRNQWKRERLAPSFHVDDKNLDPKTWCRYPILSGAFRSELDAIARDAPRG